MRISASPLAATIALVRASGMRYKVAQSLATGQMAVYAQTIGASVLASGTPVNTPNLVASINDGLTAQGFDFLPSSTTVGFLGMAMSDTYYPEVWVNLTATADGRLAVVKKDGTLVAPAVIALAVLFIMLGFFAVDVYWNIYKAEHSYAYRDPNDGTTKTILGETQFLTTMNALYWFTCPKDGTGVGLKSKYPTLAAYQAAPEYATETAYLKDHCESAQNLIGARLNDWLTSIVIAAVVVGGIYVVAKVIPAFVGRKKG